MRIHFAKCHVGIDGQRYTPGEKLPPLTDEQYESLVAADAIETIEELGEEQMQNDPHEPNEPSNEQDSSDGDDNDGENEGNEDEEESESEDEDEEPVTLPSIDATAGIVNEENKPTKRGRKAGNA